MTKDAFRKVPREEFRDFLTAYPHPLVNNGALGFLDSYSMVDPERQLEVAKVVVDAQGENTYWVADPPPPGMRQPAPWDGAMAIFLDKYADEVTRKAMSRSLPHDLFVRRMQAAVDKKLGVFISDGVRAQALAMLYYHGRVPMKVTGRG